MLQTKVSIRMYHLDPRINNILLVWPLYSALFSDEDRHLAMKGIHSDHMPAPDYEVAVLRRGEIKGSCVVAIKCAHSNEDPKQYLVQGREDHERFANLASIIEQLEMRFQTVRGNKLVVLVK